MGREEGNMAGSRKAMCRVVCGEERKLCVGKRESYVCGRRKVMCGEEGK